MKLKDILTESVLDQTKKGLVKWLRKHSQSDYMYIDVTDDVIVVDSDDVMNFPHFQVIFKNDKMIIKLTEGNKIIYNGKISFKTAISVLTNKIFD